LIGTVWGRGYVLRDPTVGIVASMPMQAPRAVA
jgi:hypothetical protein